MADKLKHRGGNAFRKETLRSIARSAGRFAALAAIVALGTGFYAGLRMACPDMKLSADRYYDGTELMDIRVVSTMGLTDADMDALRAVEGVAAVMPAYETDVMATINDEQYAVRVHSLPGSAAGSVNEGNAAVTSGDAAYLNRVVLTEGRWPQKPGECVISADRVMNSPTALGDAVRITEGSGELEDTLVTCEYTIVGYAHSPYYVSSAAMGTTTLGSGAVQQFMYVTEGDFDEDYPYTEAFIAVSGARELMAGSDEYERLVGEVMGRVEALAPEREDARIAQLRGDAQAELDEARAEYESERDDALDRLADAYAQLEDAAVTLADSERKIADGQMEYDEGVAQLARERELAEEQMAQAAATLDESQAEVDAGRAELAEGRAQLDAAWAQAGMTPEQAPGALALIDARIAMVKASFAASAGFPLEEAAARAALMEQQMAALQGALAALDPAAPGYEAQKSLLETQVAGLQTALEGIAAAEQAVRSLEEARAQLVALQTAQTAFDEQAAAAEAELAAGQAAIDAGRTQLAESRVLATQQFALAEQRLAQAAAQLADGRAQLADGRADYEEGLAEYESSEAEAHEQFADAEEELADAQRKIDDIEHPEWLVMDRTKNYGAVSFSSDAERVDNIAAVFPFIFFLVAALVALTTMTRMVEEERVLIGTFKALGYSRARITSKYLVYAGVASILGAIVGIAVLSFVLPFVVMEAYAIIYSVPRGPLPVDPPIALLSAGLGVGITLVATAAAAVSTLREQPAHLMLPRAPKAGKRILLERIRPVWRRLSFSWKVTFRNLFRYKKRLIMTVIGIAGCTALLLTGLGLQDSINDIIDKHFGQIVRYNVVVSGEDDMDEASRSRFAEELGNADVVYEHTWAHERQMIAVPGEGSSQTGDANVSVVVPEDPAAFAGLWKMRERVGAVPLDLAALGDEGVIVTEKLANRYDVGVGDAITLAVQDDMGNATNETYELRVAGVMENYLFNYVFATAGYYERELGETPAFSTAYACMSEDAEVRSAFNERVRGIEGVKTVAYNDETIDSYRTMLRSVNMVVVVLVIAAAALAFIVLYNLTNINITERQREIATLKVLGFVPHEVRAYIFREIILLTIIGCLVGLVLGVFMEGFVVVTAEVDQVMFGRDIHPPSFAVAFVLTMAFSVLVMFAMRRKLARIDMVESLKSNE